MSQLIPPPLSLYIHFPWCVRKCPYCDFNSHQLQQDLPEQAYLQALIADLQQDLPDVWGRNVHSIFMGGGTPSLFSAEAMRSLLSQVRALLPITPDAEITMEINPGSQEFDDLEAYRAAGINRLSFGIQSLQDHQLKTLGRIHTADQAITAVKKAQAAGFDNINLDMMFALPEQNLVSAHNDLQALIDLQPQHISYYQLTLEPNTLFASKPPVGLPANEHKLRMYQQGQQLLQQAGFEQYEVSAFARNNKRSQHNLNYWSFGDYLAIGAGAHSKISFGHDGRIRRQLKHKHPKAYLQKAHAADRIVQSEFLTAEQLPFEFMLNAVRLKQPISLKKFEDTTGLNRASLIAPLETLADLPWFSMDADYLQLTEEGFLLSDEILKAFL
ncbi:radical SAM family heme chaperone HemW [Marinicella sp. W31]|uniref:radical SAM family heme chaperone HemW n=1 Tax=Marinicella sp. W31 TaxID=3023713 RepID=UPI00375843B3